ncbi:E3 SUMO-protein ligase ZBED1-like [Alosa pseudoharengus]|uniref:E3 SUMO-protein ligase ZBED1-like n=1 Tax=Alosa pseudoharengus TaxID=34774 RepID=UPI003F8AFEF5
MLRHLRAKHPLTVADDDRPTPTTESVPTEGRKKELDDALLNMIVKDLQPFSIVEDEGFRALVKKLDPTYTLPSRKTLKAMMSEKYAVEKEKAVAKLHNIPAVCLTADMWTSLTMDSYLGVTCHYTDANTNLGSVLLGVAKFPKAHTADNIKEALSHLITDWGLTGMVTTLVTDNAANMVAATEKLGLRHLPCFAHTLNLIVKKAVEEHEALTEIRTRARRVVTYFRSSSKANDKLILAQERMGRQTLKLVQEVETRWNSTHDMLQRLLDLREPVGAALASLSSDIMPLSSVDFEVISQSLEVLAPFKHATTELSEEKRVSASKVIPIIRMIQHKVAEKTGLATNPAAVSLGMALQQYTIRRCRNVESIRILALATLLDPRFKTLGFGNQDNAREAERLLTGECTTIIRSTSQSTSQAEPSTSQGGQNPASTGNLWELLDSRVSETQKTQSCNANATIEVKRYLNDAYLLRTEDPLKYWQAHKAVYPHLYALASKYLSLTGTSVPCERIFSKAGDVINGDVE